jgi:uncharacterized protein YfaS (alpha-2-macroglobulin family)
MKTCDQYRELILDHLYGLSDASEQTNLAHHLETCEACRVELARAEKQKRLLGVAARTQVADFQFRRPVEQRISASQAHGRQSAGFRMPWAMAAAVLVAVAGLGIPGAYYWHQKDRVARLDSQIQAIAQAAERAKQDYHDRVARADADVQSVQKQMQEAMETREKKLQQIQSDVNTQQLNVTVTGPQTLVAGAPNRIQVATTNLNRQPAPASLTVKVVNDKEEVLFKKENLQSTGNQEIHLPADLPLTPKSELSLVVSARSPQGGKGDLSEKISLAAPTYLTHLATDKPMYQPGETVHFRSLTLDRFSLKPAAEDLQLTYVLTKPTGEKTELLHGTSQVISEKDKSAIKGPDGKAVRGIGAGEYPIDLSAPGGEYTLTVSEAANRFPSQDRKFIVNRYEKPRLNKELEFTAKAYGPGDTVVAACKAARAEGGKPVAGQPVMATVNIDGVSYDANGQPGGPLQLQTDATGGVSVRFKLPTAIQTGQATLSVRFQDQGLLETLVRPIPIVLKKLNIEFFPEGGDLAAGVANRVYFQARTTLDKPAELKGKIVDETGKEAATAETFNDPDHPEVNQGMGAFTFVPEAGKKYRLQIENPAGIEGQHTLPEVKADGVVMSIPKGITASSDPISVKVQSPGKDRSLIVGAYCRGRLLAHQSIEVKKGESKEVELLPDSGAGGVVRATVFERLTGQENHEHLVPRAERLLYRTPKEYLNLEIKTDHEHYVPGDRVKVTVKSSDENQQPAPAIVMLAVVDKSVLKLADEKTYRSMPAHVLLTTEIRRPEDLEHADFLLGSTPGANATGLASAEKALDLLLGTQGWRRFAEQDPGKFQSEQREEAQRLLVLDGQFRMQSVDYVQHEMQEVEKSFQTQWADLQARLPQANQALAEAVKGDKDKEELKQLNEESEKTSADYRTAVSALGEYKDFLNATYLPWARIVLIVIAGATLIIGLRRWATASRGGPGHASAPGETSARRRSALPVFVATVGSVVLFALLMKVPVESTNLPPADRVARFDLDLSRELAQEKSESLPAAGMGGGAGWGKFGGGLGGMGHGGPAEALGRAGAARGLGAAKPAAPGGIPAQDHFRFAPAPADPQKLNEMQEENLHFGMKNAQPLDLNRAFQLKKNQAQLGFDKGKPGQDAAKAMLRDGVLKLEQQVQQMDQKKEMKAPALQNAEKDKRALLRQEGEARGGREMMRRRMGGLEADRKAPMAGPMAGDIPPPPPQPFVVRQYAHLHTHSEGNVRTDFAETLFWQPVLVLPDGQAEATFELCDSVTTFQVLAAGHTLDGRIGETTAELTSRKPLVLQPKLPIEVTAGDRIDVPLNIANNTGNQQTVNLQVDSGDLNLVGGKKTDAFMLHPEQRTRRVYHFEPGIVEGEAKVRFTGDTNQASRGGPGHASAPGADDSIETSIKVVPQGFPIVGSQSDLLEGAARNDVVLPETWIPGTLKYQVSFYPSTLADLQKGLEAMLREPCGCFEQTSTSNYPNLLVLNYLKETDQAKPEVARRAQDLLARGYQMLTSFECLNSGRSQKEGYEWFGGTAPAHEALTAYGLMEFRDMAKVYDVDKAMLLRTQKYLMSQKNGQGGFKRNPRALDTFGRAPENITNAYIVWALTESGNEDDVTKELDVLADQAKGSKDAYFLALVAHSLLNRGRNDEGVGLLKKVAEGQTPDGHLDAQETSITGSGGRDLQIETTALALHAWLKAKRPELFNKNIQSAVKWIGQQRGGFGGFGSTQSTILALKALIAYAKANKKTAEAGDLIVYLADQEVARKHFPAGAEEAVTLELPDAEKLLKPGKNSLRIEATGKNAFPYTATWSYRTVKPASAENCPVGLVTRLDRQEAGEGETVRLTIQVENKSGKGQGMTVAIVGLPAGLTLPEDMKQLKDMARLRNDGTERGEIDAWETRGRELILYWRDLAPDKKIEVNVQVICRVPGEYQGPASRAYLYYNADTKHWVEPLKMKIRANEAQ